MLRERNFRPQIKVIKIQYPCTFNFCYIKMNQQVTANDQMSVYMWLQSSTANCCQRRRTWTTRTRRSRPYTAAWLKPWSPRSDWSRELWSLWRCPNIVCPTTRCRPGFRWANTKTHAKNNEMTRNMNIWRRATHSLYTLTQSMFNRNFWMTIKIFRSRMRACRPRSLHRYIC